MSEYNQFVLAVNSIFEITAKLKAGWKDQDNVNIADSVEESKLAVVEAAKLFSNQVTSEDITNSDTTSDAATKDSSSPNQEIGALGQW